RERLTAKQIKQDIREDEVQSFLITAIEKFQENPSLYVGLVVGFLAAGVGASGIYAFLQSRQAVAQESLGAVVRTFAAPIVEEGAEPADEVSPSFESAEARRQAVEEAIEGVRGGDAGEVAELYEAQLALEDGDAEKARQIWQSFLRSNDDHALAVTMRLNLIQLDRAEGKTAEVAERLQSELDGSSRTLPEDVLLIELARCREELGESEAAKELYQRILDELPTSPYAAEARQAATTG
ncbi:MAG: tetratricopeptide repeat protein, partial [Holophagales bacterium]|nr:tetratricopeptide repeat protein [Holophagales bacterium]